MRTRFEYMVAFVDDDRVLTTNGHWQGTVPADEAGAKESCPSLFDFLAEAGAQGWELVALDPEAVGTARLFFKRSHVA